MAKDEEKNGIGAAISKTEELAPQSLELSEEDLDNIAGGLDETNNLKQIGTAP